MISVIIPCKNRLNKIKLCINSIIMAINFAQSRQINDTTEIIIVNDHSNDGFKETLLKEFPHIRIVDSTGNGPGYARNLGIRASKGNYLFFTDSDCVVSKDWIYNGYKVLKSNHYLVIQGIPWLFQKNENEYLGMQEEKLYEIMFSTYLYDKNLTKMTDSRNLLINKSIVEILGNEVFSEKTNKATAESRVFGNRCISHGVEIYFDHEIKIYHEDSLDMKSVCNQKYRHGSGRVEIWSKIPEFDFLENRYFDNPIISGVDKTYVVPAHIAFLLGYFQTLNIKSVYDDFLKFLDKVLNKYDMKLSDFNYIKEIMDSKTW